MKRLHFSIVVIFSILFVLLNGNMITVSAEPAKLTEVKMPKFINLKGTTIPGTGADIMSKIIVRDINENFPQTAARNIPGGTREGMDGLEAGRYDMAFGTAATGYKAWFGLGDYKNPYLHLRTLAVQDTATTLYFVTLKDSPINSWADLYNKRICPGMKESTIARFGVPPVLKHHGITYKSIQDKGGLVYFARYTDALEMLAAKRLDAVLVIGPDPIGALSTIDLTRGIKILPMSDKEIEILSSNYFGAATFILRKDKYKSVKEDVKVVL